MGPADAERDADAAGAVVRQEVLKNLQILGRGGGYILAPCHNIQPITPVENILAMYEAGYEYGWV